MWKRKILWTDEGRVKGPESRRIEELFSPDGVPVCFEIVVLWDGVPIHRVESKRKPNAPNRHGRFIR